MPAIAIDIIGSGSFWSLVVDGRPRANRFRGYDQAHLAKRAMERRLAPVLTIPCLCCKASFRSTGNGHRLCPSCKENA